MNTSEAEKTTTLPVTPTQTLFIRTPYFMALSGTTEGSITHGAINLGEDDCWVKVSLSKNAKMLVILMTDYKQYTQ